MGHTLEEMTASDIMTSSVVSLNEDLDLHECEKILVEKGISGAPVVDINGTLRGVLSKTDIVSFHYTSGEEGSGRVPDYRIQEPRGGHVVEFGTPTARDVMTPVPCITTEGATIGELAALMTRKEVHRVIICRNRRVVGIVTSMDILRAIANPVREWDVSGFPG